MLDVGGASATMFQSAFMEQVHSCDHPTETGAAIELCRTFLFPHTHGAFGALSWSKAPRPPRLAPAPPANHRAPAAFGPAVLELRTGTQHAEKPRRNRLSRRLRARRAPPARLPRSPDRRSLASTPGARQRGCARAPRRAYRGRGGAATGHRRRDAWYLRHAAEVPDPPAACCKPGGGSPRAIRSTKRFAWCAGRKTGCLDCWTSSVPLDDALEDVGDAAKTLAAGEGSAIAAAAWRRQLAKTSRRRSARPVARRRRARYHLRWPRR